MVSSWRHCAGLCWILLCVAGIGRAEDCATDSDLVRQLLVRIDSLEQRVRGLEGGSKTEESAKAADIAEATEDTSRHAEAAPGVPVMNIRGFGEAGYSVQKNPGFTNNFFLGEMDLFLSSRLSNRVSALVDAGIDHDRDNSTNIALDRYLLQYRAGEYLNLSVGRYVTDIGYYNTAYLHGGWLQTAATRPVLFRFDDDGGLLPTHEIGVTATGLVPSGSLGLHYTAEIGNGRSYRNAELVQNVVDENNGKSVNVALWARPDALPGWQFGASLYRDNLTPLSGGNIRQYISSAYAALDHSGIEFLNEAIWMRHNQRGRVTSVPGLYSQLSYRLGAWRPYFRYEWMNRPGSDPVILHSGEADGLMQVLTAGVRYDFTDFAALKLQTGHEYQRSAGNPWLASILVSFTF